MTALNREVAGLGEFGEANDNGPGEPTIEPEAKREPASKGKAESKPTPEPSPPPPSPPPAPRKSSK